MLVVCPHAGDPHPDTVAVLDRWQQVEYRDVSGSDTAYADLLCELWAAHEPFCIVEHDVVPNPWTLAEMALCPHSYCAAPYPWGQAVGVALGCTSFSSIFTRAHPDAVEIARRIPSNYGQPGHWRQLDVWLQAAVLRDLYGRQPHCHLPAVGNRKWDDRTPADAPVRTKVEGRCYLEPGLVERIAGEVRQAPA